MKVFNFSIMCPIFRFSLGQFKHSLLMCNRYFDVKLRKGDSVDNTVLYVIEGHGESLLGRVSSFDLGILKQVNSVGSPLKAIGKAN